MEGRPIRYIFILRIKILINIKFRGRKIKDAAALPCAVY